MKALLCREFGPLECLALEEVSFPIAGNGHVVVCRQGRGSQLSRHAHRAREVSDPPLLAFFTGRGARRRRQASGEGVAGLKVGNILPIRAAPSPKRQSHFPEPAL